MIKKSLFLLFCCINVVKANPHKVEEVLTGYMDAWTVHDISKIASFYDQNVIWYDLSSDSTVKGKEKVSKKITDAFMGYVPDMFQICIG